MYELYHPLKISSFRKTRFLLFAKRAFMRNPVCFYTAREPNGIPDKIAFSRQEAEKSDFSGMTPVGIYVKIDESIKFW